MKKLQKKVAIFDIDGTIFRNSLLIELHWKMVKAGLIPRTAIKSLDRKYWRWVQRKGSYDDYLVEVIESFDQFIVGVPVKKIQGLARKVVVVQSNIVYRYTRDLIEKLRKTHLLVAISGSPHIVVSEFARAWKFDHFIGTANDVKNGKFTNKPKWVASADKAESLRILQERHGFKLGKDSVGVGDTESDIKILELVDRPICLNPTAELYALADKRGWLSVFERKNTVVQIKKGRVMAHGGYTRE